MTADELKSLKKLIVTVADYYGRDLRPEVITMMAQDLSEHSFESVVSAYNRYRQEDKTMRFPMPATILALVQREVDPKTVAVEAASRALAAVSKFGWNNPKDARAYIGDLGWRAIDRLGGWLYICENLGVNLSVTTVQAQIRDLCESTIKLNEAGVHDQPIGLAPPKDSPVAKLVADLADRKTLGVGRVQGEEDKE